MCSYLLYMLSYPNSDRADLEVVGTQITLYNRCVRYSTSKFESKKVQDCCRCSPQSIVTEAKKLKTVWDSVKFQIKLKFE